jgi:hypothetical protein
VPRLYSLQWHDVNIKFHLVYRNCSLPVIFRNCLNLQLNTFFGIFL